MRHRLNWLCWAIDVGGHGRDGEVVSSGYWSLNKAPAVALCEGDDRRWGPNKP